MTLCILFEFPFHIFCSVCRVACYIHFSTNQTKKKQTKQNTKEIHTLQATRAAVSFFSTPEQVKLPWIIATRRRGAKGKPYGGRKEAIPFDLLSFSLIHFSLSLFCLFNSWTTGKFKKKKRPPTTVTTCVRLYVTLTSLFIVLFFFFPFYWVSCLSLLLAVESLVFQRISCSMHTRNLGCRGNNWNVPSHYRISIMSLKFGIASPKRLVGYCSFISISLKKFRKKESQAFLKRPSERT